MIEKFPGANTLQVTRDIEAAMADMAPGLKGITVDPNVYRPATFIETALHNAGRSRSIGLALLVALMLLLLVVLAGGGDRRHRGAGVARRGGLRPVPAGRHVHDDHAARAGRGRVRS